MTGSLGKHAWVLGLLVLFLVLIGLTKVVQPSFGLAGIESLTRAALPFAFARRLLISS